ncbi:NADP-dependent succinic semialdehyde dehydrogenase [Streptosporangium sp. G11]|uniref:NADP-dependent succinic semialdehyde dehydrogenase n=1 Tax=Streptosporangium sp. G11 TaxID=3436926 RepID=UPI003EBCA93B
MAIATINPATGETLRTFEPIGDGEVDRRVALAASAFRDYRTVDFKQRAAWMHAAAGLLRAERDRVTRLVTTEMGKTLAAARCEVDMCVREMRFFADHSEEFLADASVDGPAVGARQAYARYQPLGPVLGVMPWNFPLWQVIRFAAPALMAGNVCLLKHAPNVPQTALHLDGLFARAGFPGGCVQVLLIEPEQVEPLLRDRRVVAATLTGSEAAGRSIAAVAGWEIKKTVLELGGSDPYVVMPSADLGEAAAVGVTSRVQNNGQSCFAAKRFIVHDEVYDDFAGLFVALMESLRLGDPADEATDVGPLATRRGRDHVESQVANAAGCGARVLCGGVSPDMPGWFYEPTVITGVTPEMRVFHEEVFGPVAALYRVADIDEAIALANATPFGLGAAAWTDDVAERERLVSEIEAGMVYVNGMVSAYPQLPFGGVKNSGYGRELSAYGIREFCNAKTVWIG